MNFAETRRKPTTLFSSASYHRLRRIKAIVDPTDLIRSNHPFPPAHLAARLPRRPTLPRGAAVAFEAWTQIPSRSGCSAA